MRVRDEGEQTYLSTFSTGFQARMTCTATVLLFGRILACFNFVQSWFR